MTRSSLQAPLPQRGAHAMRRLRNRLLPGERELPSYFVVGAKRAGTSSLHEYLVSHPDVLRGFVTKGSRYFDVNHDRGWDWFTRHFPTRRQVERIANRQGVRPILGEASPYYCFHPDAAARIAACRPDARIIMLLREPVSRAWSHHRYEVVRGFESLDIHQALDREPERLAQVDDVRRTFSHRHHSYVARGLYADQLLRLYEHFPRDQVLVLESERLFTDPAGVMATVHTHLGLAPHTGRFDDAVKANTASSVPADVQERLAPVFAEPNQQLRRLLGDSISWLSEP